MSERTWPVPITVGVLLTLAVALFALNPIAGYDIWWHIATGEQILATGSLLPNDIFSYSHAGAPWPYKDAGAAVLLYLLFWGCGPGALVWLKALAFTGTLAAMAAILWERRVVLPVVSLLLAIATAGVAFRFTERPAIFSLCLTAVVLWLVERHRAGRRGLLWCIPITALMANLHRGVLLVPILMGIYGVSSWLARRQRVGTTPAGEPRRVWIALAGCTVASLATPFGWASIRQSWIIMTGTGFRGTIPEWEPLSVGGMMTATPATAVVALLAVMAVIVLARRRNLTPWDVGLLLLAVASGLRGVRFLAYFVLFATPVIGPPLAVAGERIWRGRLRHAIAIAAACAAALLGLGHSEGPFAGVSQPVAPRRYPEAAVAFVLDHAARGELSGRMLNEFGLGGYLIHRLWPQFRVYIDGRNDLVYEEAFIARYPKVLSDPELLAAEVERFGIEWLFLHNRPHATARAHFDQDPGWALVFASEQGLIYVRRAGVNGPLARDIGYRYLQPHRLIASVNEAWRAANGASREAILAEVRRMKAEDEMSIPANVALAQALTLVGDQTEELEATLDLLWELGWKPPPAAPIGTQPPPE